MTTAKDPAAEERQQVTPTRPKRASEEEGEEEGFLWRLVTDHQYFETHVVTKLNDAEFFDVNSESRAVIKRSGVFGRCIQIGDFDTTSTISWALKCSEKKERFCWKMAENGNLELLEFLRIKGCPWDERTCSNAALNGHLECLKCARKRVSLERETCLKLPNGHLECLKYAQVSWDLINEDNDDDTVEQHVLMLPEWPPRVFEIRTRKWMSLE